MIGRRREMALAKNSDHFEDLPYEALRNKVKPRRVWKTRRDKGCRTLGDAGLPLKPANVAGDLLDVRRRDPLDLRHVTELPVMGFDAEFRSAQKGGVAVMIGLINLVDQRRALLGAGGLCTVAGGAMGVELRLARL